MPALGACLSRYWEMKKTMAGPPSAASSAPDANAKDKDKDAASRWVGVEAAGRQDGEAQEAAAAAAAIATTDDAPTPAFLSCEPAHVRSLMKALGPYTLGMSLAGAGGGGFLVCVLRDPLPSSGGGKGSNSSNNATDVGRLQALVGECVPGAYVSRVAVDEEGLALEVSVQGGQM
jgi:hypothetical protein